MNFFLSDEEIFKFSVSDKRIQNILNMLNLLLGISYSSARM